MTHTWPLHISYHACPKCGRILENRIQAGKQLICPHCKTPFSIEVKGTTSEFDWS